MSTNNSQARVVISSKAFSKISRHGMNVMPLEAFGLLVGLPESNTIIAALPSGNTSHEFQNDERFQGIERAIEVGDPFAETISLQIKGVYHTYSEHPIPLEQIPESLQKYYVLIRSCAGWETFWMPGLYQFSEKWEEVEFKQDRSRPTDETTNPRRILAAWNRIWEGA